LTQAEQALKSSGVNASALKASPQAAVEAVARLRASITAQEIKIASLRGYLSESAPEFRQALTELGAMRAQLARAEQQEAPVAGGSDYIGRYRDFKYYETLFELFAKQYELARVDESREGAVIQVLDAAQPARAQVQAQKGSDCHHHNPGDRLCVAALRVCAAWRSSMQAVIRSRRRKSVDSRRPCDAPSAAHEGHSPAAAFLKFGAYF